MFDLAILFPFPRFHLIFFHCPHTVRLWLPEGDCLLTLSLAYPPVFTGPLGLRKPFQVHLGCMLWGIASLCFPTAPLSYFLTGQAWTPWHGTWTAVDMRQKTVICPLPSTWILSMVPPQPEEDTARWGQHREEAVDSRRKGLELLWGEFSWGCCHISCYKPSV